MNTRSDRHEARRACGCEEWVTEWCMPRPSPESSDGQPSGDIVIRTMDGANPSDRTMSAVAAAEGPWAGTVEPSLKPVAPSTTSVQGRTVLVEPSTTTVEGRTLSVGPSTEAVQRRTSLVDPSKTEAVRRRAPAVHTRTPVVAGSPAGRGPGLRPAQGLRGGLDPFTPDRLRALGTARVVGAGGGEQPSVGEVSA